MAGHNGAISGTGAGRTHSTGYDNWKSSYNQAKHTDMSDWKIKHGNATVWQVAASKAAGGGHVQ